MKCLCKIMKLPFFGALINDETLLTATNCENTRLWRINNSTKMSHIEHAQIRNGEGAALKFLWL